MLGRSSLTLLRRKQTKKNPRDRPLALPSHPRLTPLLATAGFPSSRGGEGRKRRGGGGKGGGWRGGAGDQVIRIINLYSSGWGVGGSEDFARQRRNPEEEAIASGWGQSRDSNSSPIKIFFVYLLVLFWIFEIGL